MLDTNICIYLIREKPQQVVEQFAACPAARIGVSSITVAELQYGVQKSRHRARNQMALAQFLAPLLIVDFDEKAADAYGSVRAALEAQGTPIGALDALIAGHAISLEAVLVTNNVSEFSRVAGLALENWVDG